MDDPKKWTSDDLIKQLCHSTALYKTAACPTPDHSTRVSLENVIRKQKATGASLLNDVDSEVMQTMGPQSYVCIVRLLRSTICNHQFTVATKTNELLDPEESTDDDEEIDGDVDDEEGEEDLDEEEAPIDDVDSELPRGGRLSRGAIIHIINDCIEQYTKAWEPGKNQEEDHTLVQENLRSGQQQQLVGKYQAEIDWLQSRLDANGDQILECSWAREYELRRQCSSALEETVNLLQEAEWLLAICQSEVQDNGVPTNTVPANTLPTHTVPNNLPESIDLGSGSGSGSDSDDREEIVSIHTPEELDNVRSTIELPQSAPTRPITVITDNPGLASIRSVSRWDWASLIQRKDRKRIVMKVISEMSEGDRDMIRTRISNVRKPDLIAEIPACISMFRQSVGANTSMKMRGVLPRDLPKIMAFTRLFLCWWLAGDYFYTNVTDWPVKDLDEALEDRNALDDRNVFYEWVRHVFENTFNLELCSKPLAPSQAEIVVISDDED